MKHLVKILLLTVVVLCAASQPSEGAEKGENPFAPAIRDAIVSLDLAKAETLLRAVPMDAPALSELRGVLQLYQQNCVAAAQTFAQPDLRDLDDVRPLREIANGCARVSALAHVVRDEKVGVEIQFQDEHDAALAPRIVDTVVRAREALTRDLGVQWPKPTRIMVVRDHLSLSATTGLPYSAAKTTGVVGIAKWGRVTLLSPRATPSGYGWVDTLAHELTHLGVTQVTLDRAPLWLQEGLAKTEETRWREATPFDGRPPAVEIVKHGMEKHLDLPLNGLGASIALLPTAEQASVAYAEVQHFVQTLEKKIGASGMQRLLIEVGNGHSVDGALQSATGDGLAVWEARWRAEVAATSVQPAAKVPKALRESAQHLRLAELLLGRDKVDAAEVEVEMVKPPHSKADPRVRTLRGVIAERRGQQPNLGDPYEPQGSYGPLWAMKARHATDAAPKAQAYEEADRVDPLHLEVACRVGPAYIGEVHAPMCEAAKTRREPALGQD